MLLYKTKRCPRWHRNHFFAINRKGLLTDLQTNKAPVCHTVFQTAPNVIHYAAIRSLQQQLRSRENGGGAAPMCPRCQNAVRGVASARLHGAACAAVAQGSFCTKLRAARARIDALMCTTSSFFPRRPPTLACPSLPWPAPACPSLHWPAPAWWLRKGQHTA